MVEIKEGERKRKGLSLSLTLRDFFFFLKLSIAEFTCVSIKSLFANSQKYIYIYISGHSQLRIIMN